MTMDFWTIFKRGLVSAAGVFLGSAMIDGIHYDDGASLFWAVLLLAVFTAFLRPLLVLFALPFVMLTLGVGLLFINAFLYLLVGNLLEGFVVDGFGAAFFGALIISFLNVLFAGWIGGDGRRIRTRVSKKRVKVTRVKAKDDVIDI